MNWSTLACFLTEHRVELILILECAKGTVLAILLAIHFLLKMRETPLNDE